MRLRHCVLISAAAMLAAACPAQADSAGAANPAGAYLRSGASVVITNADGIALRVTPYGGHALRLQTLRKGEAAFADDHYAMVDAVPHGGALKLDDEGTTLTLRQDGADAVALKVDKRTLAARYFVAGSAAPVLVDQGPPKWQGSSIVRAFAFDDKEHFTALGHSFYGRSQAIDLKGQTLTRNYGTTQIEQAPLIVPFYISSKGYGIFLNSTFTNSFRFGSGGNYDFAIDTEGFDGRMDYFFIGGPEPKDVLTHYVELTGKPRLPPKAMFGLALSDKSHDHDSATPSDRAWWMQKIAAHRAAGFALDHVVNDNRWRAGGGKRCESYLEWDRSRYPQPQQYANWLKQNGLMTTIDVNRCILQFSEGWQTGFNLPVTSGIEFGSSAPDLSNPQLRAWFWAVLYKKSLDPALGFPGDALWIDEFDEMGGAPSTMRLANGLSFAEMRNYWFFLIAQALVRDGWDKSAITQRPYVWVRGMTAGAQRYASLWSGDIKPNFDEMKLQIRGMQLAGLSGFPFWGHDAGGFYDWDSKSGPDAALYTRWAMGFGSFAPIWKPHGMGPSRWPLDRSAAEQASAHQFTRARYQLMPYIYSAAHEAAVSGMPMARAMLLAYPHDERAWRHDLQFMWGPDLLVAPRTSAAPSTPVWLPPGTWYDYWHPQQALRGDTLIDAGPERGELPVFVKAGAIIARQNYTTSTAFADKSELLLDVYPGADGRSTLYEDDDVSEQYRLAGRSASTDMRYDDARRVLTIAAARGSYANAPLRRAYSITLHGRPAGECYSINGSQFTSAAAVGTHASVLSTDALDVGKQVVVRPCRPAEPSSIQSASAR